MTVTEERRYDFEPHPRAVRMPPMPDARYQKIKAGIAANGLQHPIRVQKGTRYLLDGDARLHACEELHYPVKVEWADITDAEVPKYTAAFGSKHGPTATQRALIAVEVLPEYADRAKQRQALGEKVRQGAEKGKAVKQAAELVGANERYVQLLVKLKKENPEIYDRVWSGELTVSKAIREVESLKKHGTREAPKERHPAERYHGRKIKMPDGRVRHLRAVMIVESRWDDGPDEWERVDPEQLIEVGGLWVKK